jgi:orotidine-5'-phosphate decarboxylase
VQVSSSKVVVALDFSDKNSLYNFIDRVDPTDCKLKIGKEMFTYFGPTLVTELVNRKFDVFLDLKFHDIPNTVAKAVTAAADLGVWMVNVHACGGSQMLNKAKDAIATYGSKAPLLIGVTVLTSMDAQGLNEIGITTSPLEHVVKLAGLCQNAGFDGVVCSAQEAKILKSTYGQRFKLVTPGIRPLGSAANDQQRIVTPEQAVADGVDYLVIGRPITQANDPNEMLKQINRSIK